MDDISEKNTEFSRFFNKVCPLLICTCIFFLPLLPLFFHVFPSKRDSKKERERKETLRRWEK